MAMARLSVSVNDQKAPLAVEVIVRELENTLASLSRAATIEILQNASERRWMICVTSSQPHAAPISVVLDDLSRSVVKISNTIFEFSWGDPAGMAAFLDLTAAVFEGSIREYGVTGSNYLRARTRNGLVNVNRTWSDSRSPTRHYGRVFAPYPRRG